MSLLLNHPVLTVRIHAGLNAASVLAGLAGLMRSPFFSLTELAREKFPALTSDVELVDSHVNGIAGVTCRIACPAPAEAEASVHGASPDKVHFHEVGRTANVVAIGLIAELFTTLNPEGFFASAVPLGDGSVNCAHGAVPNPAPALFAMLDNVAVRGFSGIGEAVTPTGLAVLLGLGATFGAWPEMTVKHHVTAYAPDKVFAYCANGLLFALGDKA